MTRKQIGAVFGAVVLAVAAPLLLLALLHGLDGTARAQPGALQDPTFSLSRGSAQVSPMGPYDAADLLTLSAGVVPPPVVALMCPVLLPFPSMFCEAYGGMPPFDDVNAGSLGRDFTLPPPDPANPSAWLYFSVAPGSTGAIGTGVRAETVCPAGPEPEADEFGSPAGQSCLSCQFSNILFRYLVIYQKWSNEG